MDTGVNVFSDLLQWLFGIDKGVLQMGPGAEWKLGWQNLPSTWLLVLVIIPAVVGLCYLLYRWEPQVSRGRQLLLAGLRMAAVAIILVLLFQPYLYNQIELQKQNHLAVLVDTSGSMTFKDRYRQEEVRQRLRDLAELEGESSVQSPDQLSRLALLKRVLDNEQLNLLQRMSKDQVLDLYRFDTDLKAQNPDGEIEPSGEEGGTAIGGAIEQVYKKQRGRKTSGIVLFTDGQSNVGVDPVSVVRNRRKQGDDLPVYTVAVGSREEPHDLVLENIEAPDAAQANTKDPVEFSVRIRSRETTWNGSTRLRLLTSDGEELVEKTINGDENRREFTRKLEWQPEQPGTYRLRLRVEPLTGEIRTENNERTHQIRIVDRKMRVFYFERLPRYEYRFLKNTMIRDDSLEVKALLYSADERYPQPTSPGLSPATNFPKTREELASYDVIVIGDVRPSMFRSLGVEAQDVLERLKTFVEELGGGVLFIAGKGFNPSAYENTPLQDLLPVISASPVRESPGSISFNPELTPVGRSHPIMQILDDREKNTELWEDNREDTYSLEPLRWYHPVQKEKLGAKTLARVPSDVTGENATPLVTVNRYGRGRTMYVGTDDTWVWRKLVGNKYFYRFWSNAMRWLRGGRLNQSSRFQLRVEKKSYSPGEKVTAFAHVLDRDFRPRSDQEMPLHVMHRETNRRRTVTMNRKAEEGSYTATFQPRELGAYRLWVGNYPFSAEDQEGEADYAEAGFEVRPLDLESQDPSVNQEGLKEIAAISGGQFMFLDDVMTEGPEQPTLPDLVHQKPERISLKPQKEDLWDAPIFLFLFLGILAAEWILRKRSRLI